MLIILSSMHLSERGECVSLLFSTDFLSILVWMYESSTWYFSDSKRANILCIYQKWIRGNVQWRGVWFKLGFGEIEENIPGLQELQGRFSNNIFFFFFPISGFLFNFICFVFNVLIAFNKNIKYFWIAIHFFFMISDMKLSHIHKYALAWWDVIINWFFII